MTSSDALRVKPFPWLVLFVLLFILSSSTLVSMVSQADYGFAKLAIFIPTVSALLIHLLLLVFPILPLKYAVLCLVLYLGGYRLVELFRSGTTSVIAAFVVVTWISLDLILLLVLLVIPPTSPRLALLVPVTHIEEYQDVDEYSTKLRVHTLPWIVLALSLVISLMGLIDDRWSPFKSMYPEATQLIHIAFLALEIASICLVFLLPAFPRQWIRFTILGLDGFILLRDCAIIFMMYFKDTTDILLSTKISITAEVIANQLLILLILLAPMKFRAFSLFLPARRDVGTPVPATGLSPPTLKSPNGSAHSSAPVV